MFGKLILKDGTTLTGNSFGYEKACSANWFFPPAWLVIQNL